MSRYRFATTALAAMLLAAPALHAVELQSIPGTDTKLSVYGFVYANYTYFVDARQGSNYASSLFYNVPADSGPGNSVLDTSNLPKNNFQFQIKGSRLGVSAITPSAVVGDITTKLEYDMNNPNGTLGIRHAAILFGGWTFGRYWSNWADLDASPDTIDWAGAIGVPCYDTNRYPLIQYKFTFDKQNSLAVSLEQNNGMGDGSSEVITTTPSTPKSTTPKSTGTGDGKIPSFIANYTYSDSWGHLALRGLAQNYGAYVPAGAASTVYSMNSNTGETVQTHNPATSKTNYNKVEYAGMLSGDVKFGKDDLVFNVYTGKALGSYGTGFQSALLVDSNQQVYAYKSTGWMAGYTHQWTDKVRSNIVLSGVTFSQNGDIPDNSVTDPGVNNGIKSAYNGFINTYVKFAKNAEMGLEYVYEQAKPFADNGATDSNGSPASKNSASKIEAVVHVSF